MGIHNYIIEIEYTFTLKTSDGEKTFNVIKKRGYVKARVYADENGEKKDLGEFNLFAYYGKIIPVTGNGTPLEYIVMVKERSEDSDKYFLEPIPNFGALGTGGAVVAEAKSGNAYFYWSNPGSIGQYSELPYTEGDLDEVLEDMGSYLYAFWLSMLSSGVWSGLEDRDLMKAEEYDYSFPPFAYHYRIDPDGTVTFDGKDFRVSNVEWSYSFGGVTLQGRAEISPALPIPVESEGTFVDLSSRTKAYSKIKIEGLKLSKEFGGMSVSIEKPTSEGTSTETVSETQTETSAPSESSQNWQRAWDASEPIEINGNQYLLKSVTYDITYKTQNGEMHYTMERGYNETNDGYVAYAIVHMDDGSTYRFEVYTSNIDEYTGWVLWIPSVFELIESGSSFEKYTVQGPNCGYTYGESGISGDMNCGAEITNSPFDMLWDVYNGFAGGIYGDVVYVADLSSNGDGYTVQKDGSVSLADMTFDKYVIQWSGLLQGYVTANGKTAVVSELPIPVEIEASLAMPEGAMYLHVTVEDVELVLVS
ncbi:hypothetical protein [Thermococcus peptonophilus]|uniref:Uncharacterized protein n=1 Tax=Thermococcus peptonophilus TaxID=53952 RepID=A0A142CUQ0_9EURY|nr:hypothetical protein [Thermococcus peptonophilus]AMQ18502.1 hypothetical protein A0127_04625 [Thermococcus peptonophilus]